MNVQLKSSSPPHFSLCLGLSLRSSPLFYFWIAIQPDDFPLPSNERSHFSLFLFWSISDLSSLLLSIFFSLITSYTGWKHKEKLWTKNMPSLGFNSFVSGCQFFHSHKTWVWCSLKIFACLLLALSSDSYKTHMVMECWFLPGFLIPQQVLNCVNVFVKDKSCYGYNSLGLSATSVYVWWW